MHKDYSHLKHAPSPESQKIYRASTPIAEGRGNELATVPEEDPGLETEAEEWAQGASAEELLEAMNETNVDDLLNESEEPVEVFVCMSACAGTHVVCAGGGHCVQKE